MPFLTLLRARALHFHFAHFAFHQQPVEDCRASSARWKSFHLAPILTRCGGGAALQAHIVSVHAGNMIAFDAVFAPCGSACRVRPQHARCCRWLRLCNTSDTCCKIINFTAICSETIFQAVVVDSTFSDCVQRLDNGRRRIQARGDELYL